MCFEAAKVPITGLKLGSLFSVIMDFDIYLIILATLGANPMNSGFVP